jgi:hypothetical protein
MDMIAMYREIIDNRKFKDGLEEICGNKKNKQIWEDTTDSKNDFVIMEADSIIENIHRVLDKWESFGFYFFIHQGKCPPPIREKGNRSRKSTTQRYNDYVLGGCKKRRRQTKTTKDAFKEISKSNNNVEFF